MISVTVAVRASNDGSFTIPKAAAETLGLHPGDEVHVRIVNEASPVECLDQNELQARLDRFFEHLDTIELEKPTSFPGGDELEKGFAEIMDKKYERLGFKP